MPKKILEHGVIEASKIDLKTGIVPVQLITPGWGSSGYYSPKVLEAGASLFKTGTLMFLDHPTATEERERPIRSVKDIGAKLIEDATWDGNALVSKAQLVGPYKDALVALREDIGLSIRGSATDVVEGEAEGRKGGIVEGLADIASVDFVTKAGRGGQILDVVESARREDELLHEATASDRLEHLRTVVRDANKDLGSTWVRDHDAEATTVWFDAHPNEGGPSKTYQQEYTVGGNDVDVSLTGDPVEVKSVTQYVPVTRPGSTKTTTQESKEDTMPQIEEARLRELEEAHGRVPTLEAERDTAVERATKAEKTVAEQATAIRSTQARAIIAEHDTRFDEFQAAGLLANLPVVEDGTDLDAAAFKTRVDEAAAKIEAARGTGTVTGFGAPVGGAKVEESTKTKTAAAVAESTQPRVNPWGRKEGN